MSKVEEALHVPTNEEMSAVFHGIRARAQNRGDQQCKTCGHTFWGDPGATQCPECHDAFCASLGISSFNDHLWLR